ncbi:hypothetical protein C8Q76DRAFT_19687 [Earliella scabrosa]|nr:hypothetical protein C8Q76DRAFT_19687 [Earliella scabrosa]
MKLLSFVALAPYVVLFTGLVAATPVPQGDSEPSAAPLVTFRAADSLLANVDTAGQGNLRADHHLTSRQDQPTILGSVGPILDELIPATGTRMHLRADSAAEDPAAHPIPKEDMPKWVTHACALANEVMDEHDAAEVPRGQDGDVPGTDAFVAAVRSAIDKYCGA